MRLDLAAERSLRILRFNVHWTFWLSLDLSIFLGFWKLLGGTGLLKAKDVLWLSTFGLGGGVDVFESVALISAVARLPLLAELVD